MAFIKSVIVNRIPNFYKFQAPIIHLDSSNQVKDLESHRITRVKLTKCSNSSPNQRISSKHGMFTLSTDRD